MSSHVAYKPSQELPGDVGFEDWVTIVAPVTIAIPAQQFALRVQAGYRRFNGASIPRWAQWFLGDPFDPAYVPPALVHDYLYDLPSKRGEVGYKGRRPIQKDGIDLAFYELLIDNGVTASTASVMYWAVAYYPHGAYQPGPADPLNAFDPSVSQESMASQSSASTSFAEPLRRTRDLTPARQEREAVLLHAAPVLKRLTLARDDAAPSSAWLPSRRPSPGVHSDWARPSWRSSARLMAWRSPRPAPTKTAGHARVPSICWWACRSWRSGWARRPGDDRPRPRLTPDPGPHPLRWFQRMDEPRWKIAPGEAP